MTLHGVTIVTTTWNEREKIKKLIPKIRDVPRRIEHEILSQTLEHTRKKRSPASS